MHRAAEALTAQHLQTKPLALPRACCGGQRTLTVLASKTAPVICIALRPSQYTAPPNGLVPLALQSAKAQTQSLLPTLTPHPHQRSGWPIAREPLQHAQARGTLLRSLCASAMRDAKPRSSHTRRMEQCDTWFRTTTSALLAISVLSEST
jgi:hypothetical protein